MYTCILDIKNINKKPILIFFHGFAASGVLYYHLYKRLVERFCVIFADQVGMGGSSRPNNFYIDDFSP
jgi:pimeloyl-ACP methyl ester carboxylesterase